MFAFVECTFYSDWTPAFCISFTFKWRHTSHKNCFKPQCRPIFWWLQNLVDVSHSLRLQHRSPPECSKFNFWLDDCKSCDNYSPKTEFLLIGLRSLSASEVTTLTERFWLTYWQTDAISDRLLIMFGIVLQFGLSSLTPQPTQYRSFRSRSSQPITWLILTNKTALCCNIVFFVTAVV